MKKLLTIITVMLTSCTVTKYVPVDTKENVRYIDSLVVNYVDSTITIPIYKEVYRDYTNLLDTLTLSTTYSQSKSWVDTTNHMLKGEITNTKDSIQYVTRIKYVDRVEYKDSVVVKEVPVEVEVTKYKVPKWSWFTLAFCILTIVMIGLKIYMKTIKG